MPVSTARVKLLDVARRRFAIDGALAATLEEVRREAGVSVGALYHHFPDKAALAAAVCAQAMSDYWLAGGEPKLPRGAVKTFADAAWAALRANNVEEELR